VKRPPLPVAAAILTLLGVPAVVLAQSGSGNQYALPPEPATSAPLPPLVPKPAIRRTAVIQLVSGKVTYKRAGAKRAGLTKDQTAVPMGTDIDASAGRVRVIVSRDKKGHTSRSLFYDGRFVITQGGGATPITELRIVGDFETTCSASTARAAAKKAKRRRLWGDGHGRFRTRGRYSAATVRGTKWLVEDRCDGTLTRVARGVVDVEDFTATEQTDSGAGQPLSGGGESGGGAEGGGSPSTGADQPAPTAAPEVRSKPRKVRVRKGGSFVAGPGK
jgi:hypothetical protein